MSAATWNGGCRPFAALLSVSVPFPSYDFHCATPVAGFRSSLPSGSREARGWFREFVAAVLGHGHGFHRLPDVGDLLPDEAVTRQGDRLQVGDSLVQGLFVSRKPEDSIRIMGGLTGGTGKEISRHRKLKSCRWLAARRKIVREAMGLSESHCRAVWGGIRSGRIPLPVRNVPR